MRAPIRPARKRQIAPATTTTPATLALSDIAAIRWRANGTGDTTVTLTAEQLAGVLRIAEDLWYADTLGWSMLSYNGIALDASDLRNLLGDDPGHGTPEESEEGDEELLAQLSWYAYAWTRKARYLLTAERAAPVQPPAMSDGSRSGVGLIRRAKGEG